MPIAEGGSVAPCEFMFDRPTFIISAPRSGSTLLFETLAKSPDLATIGGESHRLIEGVPGLAIAARGWRSNRLSAEDATPDIAASLVQAFQAALRNREGNPVSGRVRMLEKTPKNALRVPFLDAIWPDAEFIFLYRDPRQTLASMIEAWQSGYFRTYPRLPGWTGLPWSLLLVPGWEQLRGLPLPQIVAHQWARTIAVAVADLANLPAARVRALTYEELLAAPEATIPALARAIGVGWDRRIDGRLPISGTTVSAPAPDKWRAVEPMITEVWPIVAEADGQARAFAESHRIAN